MNHQSCSVAGSPALWRRRVPSPSILLLSCYIVVLPMLASCRSTSVRDNLPPDAPKGYVEFYYLRSENVGDIYDDVDISALCVRNDREGYYPFGRIRPIGSPFNDKRSLRVALRPATYSFSVRYGGYLNDPERVVATVKEGKVTPIRIHYQETDRSVTTYGNPILHSTAKTTIEISFKMDVTAEEPVPLEDAP